MYSYIGCMYEGDHLQPTWASVSAIGVTFTHRHASLHDQERAEGHLGKGSPSMLME